MRANMNQGKLSFVNTKRSTNKAWSDFDARFYDPELGRWHLPNPANQYASPYVGMGNNPVCRVDLDGKMDSYGLNYVFSFK
jgi:RHS repeat-associated protein